MSKLSSTESKIIAIQLQMLTNSMMTRTPIMVWTVERNGAEIEDVLQPGIVNAITAEDGSGRNYIITLSAEGGPKKVFVRLSTGKVFKA